MKVRIDRGGLLSYWRVHEWVAVFCCETEGPRCNHKCSQFLEPVVEPQLAFGGRGRGGELLKLQLCRVTLTIEELIDERKPEREPESKSIVVCT